MQKFILLLSIFSICAPLYSGVFHSLWNCDPTVNTPRYIAENLTSLNLSYVSTLANDSFNQYSCRAPLLAYHGTEALLEQLVNPSLPINDPAIAGYGLLNGQYIQHYGIFEYTQNIGHHLFFSLSTTISANYLNNITCTPTTQSGVPLDSDQITQKLKDYLKKFNEIASTQQYALICQPISFGCGCTFSKRDTIKLDFVDYMFETGFISPIVCIECDETRTALFPSNTIRTIGVPLTLATTIGLFEWLNLGATMGVVFYIPSSTLISLNSTPYPNQIIMPNQGICTIYHQPYMHLSSYVQAEHLIPWVTLTAAVGYARQEPTTYATNDPVNFPNSIINRYPAHLPYNMGYVTFAFDVDPSANQTDPRVLPRISVYYNKLFNGTGCFRSRCLGSSLGVDIKFEF